jgi:ABC-type arginine transport system ATPase subunit
MRIRRLQVVRFRAIKSVELHPGAVTVLLGPSNAGKSSLLAALDLLLHHGLGRPRVISELDFYGRDPDAGLEVEAVLGDLPADLLADVVDHVEGWSSANREVVPEPDGPGIETVLRVRVRGDADFQLTHTFAKEESGDARFSARLRRRIGWVFDGRAQDPGREFAFYQGSLIDRLFADVGIDTPVAQLRAALAEGAEQINDTTAVESVLGELGADLRRLGLLEDEQVPAFEAGPVSRRELLQALRLAFPGPANVTIPVERQGRGAQRLLLVAALLRLSQERHGSCIAAFDEPEQALEPLRQTQLVDMLREVTESGGQLFLSTHAPDIVRGFFLDDIVVMSCSEPALPLASLPVPAKRHYERWLDGGVVRGLFAPIPLLVEGPSDGPVLSTFWRALADDGEVPPMTHLGVEIINCEGDRQQPPMANLLTQVGKPVVVWAEQDVPKTLGLLREEGNVAAFLLHDPAPGAQKLEESLAAGTTISALTAALTALANDRGLGWDDQRPDLVSRLSSMPPEGVGTCPKDAPSLTAFLTALDEQVARNLVASALAPKNTKSHPPFEMKGARQGRLVAEAIVAAAGVPEPYRRAIKGLVTWVQTGCSPRPHDIPMAEPPAPEPPSPVDTATHGAAASRAPQPPRPAS